MADKKISELVSITGANTAADDYFVVVDTSGAVTYKISREELNNAIERDVLENVSITNLTSDLNTNGNDINFANNDKANFGNAADLQIYHDGSNSYITDSGSGSLYLRGSNQVRIESATGEKYFIANANADTNLYYDNAVKLATTNTGCDITGTVTANGGINVLDNFSLNLGSNQGGGATLLYNGNGNLDITPRSGYSTVFTAGNVGIGTASPARKLHIAGSHIRVDDGYGLEGSGSTDKFVINNDYLTMFTASSERVRIDSSGNVLVGKTVAASEYAGLIVLPTGRLISTADSDDVLVLRRNTTDGDIASFRKEGSTVGAIVVDAGDLTIGTGVAGLRFYDGGNAIIPRNTNRSTSNGVLDLGSSGNRFDDIYAVNATIQTSDGNEKQQIAALTDAEMTAAKAISKLFKTFKWNSAVEAKGDAARTHAGVIAQDVQAAMTAAGLDAGDYAFFISSTWWETQTEVPAVEAVEAVDAVYEDIVIPAVEEELDEDGNVIVEAQPERTEQRLVSEAIEAVEAVDAYTRTDTYDTEEEAPEGAVERTRLGIRYPELLAFVGAATEQRLANIETRLAALETS